MCTNGNISSLATNPCNIKSNQLDTATEEGFKHLEHHVTKILMFENVGLFWKSGHIFAWIILRIVWSSETI